MPYLPCYIYMTSINTKVKKKCVCTFLTFVLDFTFNPFKLNLVRFDLACQDLSAFWFYSPTYSWSLPYSWYLQIWYLLSMFLTKQIGTNVEWDWTQVRTWWYILEISNLLSVKDFGYCSHCLFGQQQRNLVQLEPAAAGSTVRIHRREVWVPFPGQKENIWNWVVNQVYYPLHG